jgi:Zn-dependent protease with chaperone function
VFCNNCGSALTEAARFCGQCGAQVKVPAAPTAAKAAPGFPAPTYELPPKDYEHPSMQKMNQLLRGSVMLRKTAESLSKKVGKPWYESTFNSILATEKRYPRVYELGRIAAQRLVVKELPSVYVELDRGYQSATYGSEHDAFVNVGSFLPRFLNDQELLFVLGHEVGHLACQHALWTTVSMFLVGQQRSNLMAEGVMGFLSNPLKIVESGVESIVTNWMRVADFTADRAALLVVGSFDTAKRAIFLLHLKSRKELDEMDIDEWVSQAEAQDQSMSKLSQMMTSATPYLGTRLIELRKFAQSPQYEALRNRVEAGCGIAIGELFDEKGYLIKLKAQKPAQPPAGGPGTAVGSTPGTTFARPPAVSKTTGTPAVRQPPATAPSPAQKVKMLNGNCPKCRAPFAFRLVALPDKPFLDIPCKKCGGTFRLKLDAIKKQAAKA